MAEPASSKRGLLERLQQRWRARGQRATERARVRYENKVAGSAGDQVWDTTNKIGGGGGNTGGH